MLQRGLNRANDSGAHCPGSTCAAQGTHRPLHQGSNTNSIMRQLLALMATVAPG